MSYEAGVGVAAGSSFVDLVYGTLALYRRRLPLLAGISALVWGPAFALELLVAFAIGVPGAVSSVQPANPGANESAAHTLIAFIALVILIMVVAGTLSQASLLVGAADEALQGRPAASMALRRGLAAFGRLLSVLAALAVLILVVGLVAVVAFVALIDLSGLLGGRPQTIAVALLFLVSIVMPLFVFARFLVAPAIAVLEGAGPLTALQRAYAAVSGRYWPLFWLLVVVSFLGWLISTVVNAALSPTATLGPGAGLLVGDLAGFALAVLFGPLPPAMLITAYRAGPQEGRAA